MHRRGLLGAGLLAAALPALAGCGFQPLYGGGAVAGDASVRGRLGAVRVALVPERFGQLLRRALYMRMGQGVTGPAEGAALFELRTVPVLTAEGVGIQRDGTATRVRYTAQANWVLVRLGTPVEMLASGVERSLDSYNIPPNQFFASDRSREAAEARLAESLAELVVARIAVYFHRQAEGRPTLTGSVPVVPVVPVPAGPPVVSPPLVGPTGSPIVPGLPPVVR